MNILKSWREPINALTHLLALIIIFPTTIFLMYDAFKIGSFRYFFATFIFSLSINLLYLASGIYHLVNGKVETIKLLKKIDHMMIFMLIAGTYTPICVIKVNTHFAYTILTIVWIIAIIGIFLKIFWINAPRWFSTSIYVIMGWISVFAAVPVINTFSIDGILWLAGGGILYTIGAVIYATKYPKINFKYLGFHEIFHLFVIGGSFCHIYFIFNYVLK